MQELGGDFEWRGTWRETYLAHAAPGYKLGSHKPLQVMLTVRCFCTRCVCVKCRVHVPSKMYSYLCFVGIAASATMGCTEPCWWYLQDHIYDSLLLCQHGAEHPACLPAFLACQVSGFYSDLLNQPWFCATVELQGEWLEVDNIDRCF